MRLLPLCSLLLLCPTLAQPPAKPPDVKGPLSPAESLKHFQLAPGLRMELVASDPQIESPVALAFDEHGKLWVVEMRDYPNGPAKGEKPAGRIRVLEDKDGDGRYETSTVFADNLLFANGVLPWKGGVIVTAAPHILYLKDTDGDGKADVREVLWEGFAAQNPQLRVSHPNLGVDGWIYVANGLRGGKAIKAGDKNAKPIDLSGRDFRFDPITGAGEAISGMGQFGNTFDDWGQRFVCDNRHHLRHVVIQARYLERNPHLAVPALLQDTSELDMGLAGSGGKVYPLSKNWTTSNLHAGRFTAACGVFIYRGSLLPEPSYQCAFTCDPTGNLVHAEKLERHGATFRSKPLFDKKEFLASPDDWFRPVFLAHGPDDALYVVDMCRAVIEHPEFMPPELQKRPDLTLGKERGRIWRIVPEKHKTKPLNVNLRQLSGKKLVDLLLSHQPWERGTAQRLLLEKVTEKDFPDEHLKLWDRESDDALARYHRAWLRHRRGLLNEDDVLSLMSVDHPLLNELGVQFAEPRLARSLDLQRVVLSLARNLQPGVRFQVACSLGEWDDDRIVPALAQIAVAGAEDKWTRLAVGSSVATRSGMLLRTLLADKSQLLDKITEDRLTLVQELAAIAGARRDPAEVSGFLGDLGKLPPTGRRWQTAGLLGLTEGMGRRGTRFPDFLARLPEAERPAVALAEKLLARSAGIASDNALSLQERLEAVRLLAHSSEKVGREPLLKLLRGESPPTLRQAAVRSLGAFTTADIPQVLLDGWAGYTPALRQEVAEALLRQPIRVEFLLKQLEAGKIKARELDPVSRRRLVAYPRADLRERATKALASATPEARKQVIARFRPALELKGDAKKGLEVFKQHCAACHRIMNVGHITGPDISDTRTKTLEQLLIDVLDPNAAIDANYLGYQVTAKDGRVFSGLIAAETAVSLTLRRGDNQQDVILRQDIDEVLSTGLSLMPEGLEQNITVPQMADLLSFLKNWRYLDGSVPVGP